jgi:predicted ATPase
MKRYVVTGAPGAGKTAIIRELEMDGFSVVEEAAPGHHVFKELARSSLLSGSPRLVRIHKKP